MKLKLVAVAVSSLLAAGVASSAEVYNKEGKKLDLYGKVSGLHYLSRDSVSGSDKTYVNFGFKSETKISNQLTGYGQWEYEYKGNNYTSNNIGSNVAGDNKTGLAFAGLRFNEFGSFDYGKNYGIGYDVASFTDVLPVYGGDTWPKYDGFMIGRTSGVVTYRNNNFFGLVDGLNFAAQYRGKNGRSSISESDRRGWGISSSYEIDGFSVAATYAKSGLANNSRLTTAPVSHTTNTSAIIRSASSVVSSAITGETHHAESSSTHPGHIGPSRIGVFSSSGPSTRNSNTGTENAEIMAAGIKYDVNNIYLATTYSKTRKMTGLGSSNRTASEAYNFEAVAQYQLDFGLRPSLAYLQSKGRGIGTDSSNKDLVRYVEVGTSYHFNKNMSAYIDYKINLLDSDAFTKSSGIPTNNVVAVGMSYLF